MKGFEDLEEIRRRRDYNLAALVRIAVRGKHMPKFDQLEREGRKKKKEAMTDMELYEAVRAWNRALGGTEE